MTDLWRKHLHPLRDLGAVYEFYVEIIVLNNIFLFLHWSAPMLWETSVSQWVGSQPFDFGIMHTFSFMKTVTSSV